MSRAAKSPPADIKQQRRKTRHGCWDHLMIAPLWVAYQANLGTLLRTCDAVGACMAVPASAHYRQALKVGETLRRPPCIHWVRGNRVNWIRERRNQGARVVGVEIADDATPLACVVPARQRTIVLLGHEHNGIPDEAWDLLDEVVEIPMVGQGASLNVAVAGSLVLYRVAGLG